MTIDKLLLKLLKKYSSVFSSAPSNFGRNWNMFPLKNYANKLIYDAINSDGPLMIARLGSTELLAMTNYIGVKYPEKYKSVKGFINHQTPPWWWEKATINQMCNWSGFFPADQKLIERFCEMMIADLDKVDILGSWLKSEKFFNDKLVDTKKVMLEDLEPFFAEQPWTLALKNKKVLVVHPFEDTIKQQYLYHNQLFDNGLLPDFELLTVKAVQTIAGEKSPFKDWFEALDYMKDQIASKDFDVCILGCGAYGFPLAAFVKQLGKKAIHLGGVTQLIFGIKGSRWEDYIVYPYMNLYNDYWVRPGDKEKPRNADIVEGACYW
jgi:hypothetical protein